MAKKSNHRTVVFLQDYATKKAGEDFTCDGMLASSLVNRCIAEYKIQIGESKVQEMVSEPVKSKQKSSSSKSKK